MKKLFLTASLLLCSLFAAAAGDISFNNIAAHYGMKRYDISPKQIEYRKGAVKIVFYPPKREFYFNNMRIIPGYAPEKKLVRKRWYLKKENDIFISKSDWNTTLRPLLFPSTVPSHRVFTITLDAGHGGSDTGALGKYSKEKDITLKITKRTAAILRACGYRVLLTRNNDSTLALKERSAIQRKQNSDIFVSIHVNAVKKNSITGIETYALTPEDAPSSNGASKLEKHPANVRNANNFFLAYCLQRAMLSRTNEIDRGVKKARFAVLRDISAPGALVEVGFISSPKNEQQLNSNAHIEKICRAIAEGILIYHRNVARSR